VPSVPHGLALSQADGNCSRSAAEAAKAITAIVDLPTHCPGCLAEAGQPFPVRATTRHYPRCLDRIRRVYQCSRWNQDHAHQVAAGHAGCDAFSVRWRASGGLPPLSAEAARRYVTPEMIRGSLGTPLSEALRQTIYCAWCAGLLMAVRPGSRMTRHLCRWPVSGRLT
jgi:hypothetical protein